jgi:hypothetical protein
MTDLKFFVDVGNVTSGRTLEIEAYRSRDAYEEAKEQLEDTEKILQVRGNNRALYYSYWENQHSFITKFPDD